VSYKIWFGMLNVLNFSKSQKYYISNNAYKHYDFSTVEEYIYTRRCNKKIHETG
jgi:hypothetical protein